MRNLQATALMRDYRAQDMALRSWTWTSKNAASTPLLAGSLQRRVPTVSESDVTLEPVGVAGSK